MDPKGRVFVPKKYLAALGDTEPRYFVVTKGLDGCLVLYTASSWEKAVEKMEVNAAEGTEEVRNYARIFFSSAEQQEIDRSGRVLIPKQLAQEAGLERDVVFVGLNTKIELWDKKRWEDFQAGVRGNYESYARVVLK